MEPNAEHPQIRWIPHFDRGIEKTTTARAGWLPVIGGPSSATAPPRLMTIST